MIDSKARILKATLISAGLIYTVILPTTVSVARESLGTQISQISEQIIVQGTQDIPASSPVTTSSSLSPEVQSKVDEFRVALETYKENEINRLSRTNRAWSIFFVVSGITFTVVTTTLGAVESQNAYVQRWTKFAIAFTGAMATGLQALNTAFPVTRRAGEYAEIKSHMTILEFKINDVINEDQLADLKNEFYELLQQAGEAESATE